jgi:hypothetical protein
MPAPFVLLLVLSPCRRLRSLSGTQGEGSGTVYVSEEPPVFFPMISSQDKDWKLSISDRVR